MQPYCIVCMGDSVKRCPQCGRKRRAPSNYDKNREEILRQKEKERYEFVSKMHKRLTDLNVHTTGDPVVDAMIRRTIGPF